MSFRTYHEVAGTDRSDLMSQVLAQRDRVAKRLESVRRVVAVMSGKGGVGKSYVTAAVASAAAQAFADGGRGGGGGVGVLDADLRSPTVARLLGATGPLRVGEDGVEPVVGRGGVLVVSTDLLLDEGQPLKWNEPDHERFVWRGLLEAGTLREFLSDVVWGRLDLLLIDLPPGADGVIDLLELVPNLAGALIVTIPSEESRRSVARTMRSATNAGISILGVVENMSGYLCTSCDTPGSLFEGDAGADLAREFDVPLIGRIPFAPGGKGGGRIRRWPSQPSRYATWSTRSSVRSHEVPLRRLRRADDLRGAEATGGRDLRGVI